MNFNDISHAHIIPYHDGTTFHLVKVHVYFKEIRSTHILGASRFDLAKTFGF